MDEDDDLDSYWDDLRKPSLVQLVTNKPSNLREAAETAALKAEQNLTKYVKDHPELQPVDLVPLALRMILDCWYKDLAKRGSGDLLELVLADHRIPVDELEAFLKALPGSLIERILKQDALRAATGTHAMIAIEHVHRRDGRKYKLSRGSDGVLVVALLATKDQGTVEFRLDENFKIDD